MSEIIFKNSKKLLARDIYLAIPAAFGIVFLLKLLVSFRINKRDISWTEFLIYGAVLAGVWVTKAILEPTIKTIEVHSSEDRVLVVLERFFRGELTIHFKLSSVFLEETVKPSRYSVKNIVLRIQDGNNKLEISSRQKGLSDKVLKDIGEKLKHYAQHKI